MARLWRDRSSIFYVSVNLPAYLRASVIYIRFVSAYLWCNIRRICISRNHSTFIRVMKLANQIYCQINSYILIISQSFISYSAERTRVGRNNYSSFFICTYCSIEFLVVTFPAKHSIQNEWILIRKYTFFRSNADHENDRISFRRIMDPGNRDLPSFVAHSNIEYQESIKTDAFLCQKLIDTNFEKRFRFVWTWLHYSRFNFVLVPKHILTYLC